MRMFLSLFLPICKAKNAELNLETYPLAGKVVLDHCYRNDLIPSAPTIDETDPLDFVSPYIDAESMARSKSMGQFFSKTSSA